MFSANWRQEEKQGADFHLRAPDEPGARAVFEAAHPKRVKQREELLGGLQGRQGQLDIDDADDDPDEELELDDSDEDG